MDRVAASEAVGRGFESLQVHFYFAPKYGAAHKNPFYRGYFWTEKWLEFLGYSDLLSRYELIFFPYENIYLLGQHFIRRHKPLIDLMDHQ